MEVIAIGEALGGKKVLGRSVDDPEALVVLIRKGLPADSIIALSEHLGLAVSLLSRSLGIPPRTVSRRLGRRSNLTAAESDRTVRLARVYANAVASIGNREKAIAWLKTSNRALGGARPLDHLDTDIGARAVEDVLGRIAHGVHS